MSYELIVQMCTREEYDKRGPEWWDAWAKRLMISERKSGSMLEHPESQLNNEKIFYIEDMDWYKTHEGEKKCQTSK